MRVTYDRAGGMGYIYLVEPTRSGCVDRSVVIRHEALRDDLVIDLDSDGRILGIEVFAAGEQLPPALLAQASDP